LAHSARVKNPEKATQETAHWKRYTAKRLNTCA